MFLYLLLGILPEFLLVSFPKLIPFLQVFVVLCHLTCHVYLLQILSLLGPCLYLSNQSLSIILKYQ